MPGSYLGGSTIEYINPDRTDWARRKHQRLERHLRKMKNKRKSYIETELENNK